MNVNGISNLTEYLSSIDILKTIDIEYDNTYVSSLLSSYDVFYSVSEISTMLNNHVLYNGISNHLESYKMIQDIHRNKYIINIDYNLSNLVRSDYMYDVNYVNSIFQDHIRNSNINIDEIKTLLSRGLTDVQIQTLEAYLEFL